MKALLNCVHLDTADDSSDLDPLLTPLLDRPFVQHVVEWLVQAGFREIDVVTDSSGPDLSALFEDGTRWGCRIRMRRTPSGVRLALGPLLEEVAGGAPVLLARGDCLPVTDVSACAPARTAGSPAALCTIPRGARTPVWTGWAWHTRASLQGTERLTTAAAWQRRMQRWSAANASRLIVPTVLSVASAPRLLDAQRIALTGACPGLQIGGREIAPGLWTARGVALSRDTQVTGPVFLGENAVVRASELGPFAVVGQGAIVDAGTTVVNASVGPMTYVGPQLDVRDCVIRGRTVSHARLRETVTVGDQAWLQDLRGRRQDDHGPGVAGRLWLHRAARA